MGSKQADPHAIADYLDRIPALGYRPKSDEISDATVFLPSEKARLLTGCIVSISGGAEPGYQR
jgi:meso-butanediol dehydrogenase/(S,S)-butanediol dehydrogenase/diacetyl reductase